MLFSKDFPNLRLLCLVISPDNIYHINLSLILDSYYDILYYTLPQIRGLNINLGNRMKLEVPNHIIVNNYVEPSRKKNNAILTNIIQSSIYYLTS